MKKYFFSALILSTLAFTGCDKDKNTPEPINEEELITTVRLTFSPVTPGPDAVFEFQDLDGDGGNPPVITNDSLEAGIGYNVSIEFLNELKTPAENITSEVQAEATEHQVFYLIEPSVNLSFIYSDDDGNGHPLGVETFFITGTAGKGSLQVVLRHQPNKSATGVATGDITNAGGETDVEVTFDVSIK